MECNARARSPGPRRRFRGCSHLVSSSWFPASSRVHRDASSRVCARYPVGFVRCAGLGTEASKTRMNGSPWMFRAGHFGVRGLDRAFASFSIAVARGWAVPREDGRGPGGKTHPPATSVVGDQTTSDAGDRTRLAAEPTDSRATRFRTRLELDLERARRDFHRAGSRRHRSGKRACEVSRCVRDRKCKAADRRVGSAVDHDSHGDLIRLEYRRSARRVRRCHRDLVAILGRRGRGNRRSGSPGLPGVPSKGNGARMPGAFAVRDDDTAIVWNVASSATGATREHDGADTGAERKDFSHDRTVYPNESLMFRGALRPDRSGRAQKGPVGRADRACCI